MTWSGHQAFCPYLFCLSQEGNNLQAADWMTDVKQDLSWPILLLASFCTTLQNWFLENKWSCYIGELLHVAAHCPHGILSCVVSLSLATSTVYLAQAVAIILARFVRAISEISALLYYEDYLVWLGILHYLHSLWHASRHGPSYAQRLAASPTSKDVWGLLSYLTPREWHN